MLVGDRFVADRGNLDLGGGFMSVKGKGEWSSKTTILMSFQSSEGTYILEIPVSRITFNIQQDAEEGYFRLDIGEDSTLPREEAYWARSYVKDCEPSTWSYGWVMPPNCATKPTGDQLVISDQLRNRGISSLMDEVFKESARVELTLSPSMYNDILGTQTAGSSVE